MTKIKQLMGKKGSHYNLRTELSKQKDGSYLATIKYHNKEYSAKAPTETEATVNARTKFEQEAKEFEVIITQ